MSVVTTTVDTKKAEFKWIFRNFSLDLASKETGQKLLSPLFRAEGDDDVQWRLELYPHGLNIEDKDYISLFLRLVKTPGNRSKLNTKFYFEINDGGGESNISQLFAEENMAHVFERRRLKGLPQIATKQEILQCETLSIICKLEYGNPEMANTSIVSSVPSSSSASHEEQHSNWSGDLGKLLTDETGSDICFVINGQEIRAHKAILLARSPVFAAMFNCGMQESASGRVDIKDIAPDIFKAFLLFIYTDQVDFANVDAEDLLVAANKYLIPLLKFKCQEHLSQKLTEENCTELLMVAHVHNGVHLKKSATDFIRLHYKVVMKTDNWKDLKVSFPELAVNVIEGLL